MMQTKLSKTEWDSIEIPVGDSEKRILELIREGYHMPNIIKNHTENLRRFTKIEMRPDIEWYMYTKYFQSEIKAVIAKYCKTLPEFQDYLNKSMKLKKMKSADTIRMQNVDNTIQTNKERIFEFVLLELCKDVNRGIHRKVETTPFALYSLIHCHRLCCTTISETNAYVMQYVELTIKRGKSHVTMDDVITNITEILEKNPYLTKYKNIELFKHQKELYKICEHERKRPKLIMYIAPTGTGKTLSPIGLSEGSRVLFVCVGRHIGLALAKSAISVGKRVAFAFGCETAADIRLHYFAAADYEVNRRTGRIAKVDNSNGSCVEIMICDIQSYLCAMYYMLAFNEAQDIITYWDEPTMTLDYEEHALHEQIQKNWSGNQIPNMILSCATLPKEHEIPYVIMDFRVKFDQSNVLVQTIRSDDYAKTIPILTKDGCAFVPHVHYTEPTKLISAVEYCAANKTMLRYLDLEHISIFIKIVQYLSVKQSELPVIDTRFLLDEYFDDISDITMSSVKGYYIVLLQNIDFQYLPVIQRYTASQLKPKFKCLQVKSDNHLGDSLRRTNSVHPVNVQNDMASNEVLRKNASVPNGMSNVPVQNMDDVLRGIRLTTNDAHTLTDGPTIYFANNVLNVAKLYVHQSSIPEQLLVHIMDSISYNAELQESIKKMEVELEKKMEVKDNQDKSVSESGVGSKTSGNRKLKEKDVGKDDTMDTLNANISQLRSQLRRIAMHPEYVPNTPLHQEKWTPDKTVTNDAFVSNLDAKTVEKIMNLEIEKSYKMLVLMGIGVLVQHNEYPEYEEIVKKLAQEQKLYLILTSTDYIYGTNYQFCHGFIGKDLQGATQQKLVQMMGRIGRNHLQQSYTVRYRSNEMIEKLFQEPTQNLEAENMNNLFCTE